MYGSNDFFAPSPRNPARYLSGPSTMRPETPPAKLDVDRQTAFFESLGWLDLNDHARAIEVRGSRFELFGTSDAHRDWDRLDLLPANVDEMRANPPTPAIGTMLGVTPVIPDRPQRPGVIPDRPINRL